IERLRGCVEKRGIVGRVFGIGPLRRRGEIPHAHIILQTLKNGFPVLHVSSREKGFLLSRASHLSNRDQEIPAKRFTSINCGIIAGASVATFRHYSHRVGIAHSHRRNTQSSSSFVRYLGETYRWGRT